MFESPHFAIQFMPGCGGNFLAVFLDKQQTHFPNNPYRIDPFGIREKETEEKFLPVDAYLHDEDIDRRAWADTRTRYKVRHDMNEVWPQHKHIRILPKTNCWGYLKARFMKKEVSEKDFSNNISDINENLISEYKVAISQDYSRPYFDYGNYWNPKAMRELYIKHNNEEPSQARMQFVSKYTKNNYWVDVNKPTDMFEVLCKLVDYEYENNLINVNRIWSIDDMPENVEEALEFFESNKFKYDL